MGLDDFTSGNGSSTSSSSSNSSSTTEETNEPDTSDDVQTREVDQAEPEFYTSGDADIGISPMQRKGAMSSFSVADILRRVDSKIEIDRDQVKYYLPIFTIITGKEEYEQGKLYELSHTKDQPRASWHSKPVVCIGVIQTQLGKMNKELAMFEAGSPSKKRVMDRFDEQLDGQVTGETEVHVAIMGDMFNLRDLAQANEQFRAGELINRDDVKNKVLRPKGLRVALDKEE